MEYIILIIVNIILLTSGFIVYKRKLQQRINTEAKKYIEENKQLLESESVKTIEHLKLQELEFQREIAKKQSELRNLDAQFSITNQQLGEVNALLFTQRESAKIYEGSLREQAQRACTIYEADLRKVAEERASQYEQEKLKAAAATIAQTMADMGAQTEEARARLQEITTAIEEYGAKQAAINEAIMRQRAIEEQQDFYRVCISEDAIADISLLKDIRKNLKKPEIIDKIIYDNYIAKPVLEMVKRVLQNESFSGIYKITNLKTNEMYIGKSTDIKSRWQQHCKTVFNCGTIASSLLHIKMGQYGIENFTFEVVERVDKDQLSEREKFYIDFYQTKEYGMNQKKGG